MPPAAAAPPSLAAPVVAAAAAADDWRVPAAAQLVSALGPAAAAGLWLTAGLCWLSVVYTAGGVVCHICRRYPSRQRLVNSLLVISYPVTATASLATLVEPGWQPLWAALRDLWLGAHLTLGAPLLVVASYTSSSQLLRCVAARPGRVAAPAARRRLARLLLLLAAQFGPVSAGLGLLRLAALLPALLPAPRRHRWQPTPLWFSVPLHLSLFAHLAAGAALRCLVLADLQPAVGLSDKAPLVTLLIDVHWLQRLLAGWLLPGCRLTVASAPVLRELTLSWITLLETAEAVQRVRRAWTRPVRAASEWPPPADGSRLPADVEHEPLVDDRSRS